MSKQNLYAFTMRKCTPIKKAKQLKQLFKDYEYYLEQFKFKYEDAEVDYNYECVPQLNGSYNVHVHAIVRSRSTITFVPQKRGFSIRLKPVTSERGWLKYMSKSGLSKDDIVQYLYECELPPEGLSEDELECEDELPYKKLF